MEVSQNELFDFKTTQELLENQQPVQKKEKVSSKRAVVLQYADKSNWIILLMRIMKRKSWILL
jgi:hypothetical protein